MTHSALLRGRVSQLNHCYAVTTVTHERRRLFVEPSAAAILVDELRRIRIEGRVEPLAWVVMPDHLHWLFQLRQGTLGACLQRCKSRTARRLHALYGSQGRLWQSGYYDHRLRSETDLRQQARYLVENPLRSGLVTRIEDYPHWWCRWITDSTDLT